MSNTHVQPQGICYSQYLFCIRSQVLAIYMTKELSFIFCCFCCKWTDLYNFMFSFWDYEYNDEKNIHSQELKFIYLHILFYRLSLLSPCFVHTSQKYWWSSSALFCLSSPLVSRSNTNKFLYFENICLDFCPVVFRT